MNFVPSPGLVALQMEEINEKTLESGLVLPGDREQPGVTIAECVAVGDGVDGRLVGKKLIIGRFNGTEISLSDGTYLFVEVQHILGESVDD